jgi:tetratricopeptide (TPR) repeat protein
MDPEFDDEMPMPRRRWWRVGLFAFVLAFAAAGVGGLWLFQPEQLRDLANKIVQSGEDHGESTQAYLRGREYFLLDTTEGFEQADREYHRAQSNKGLPQAGLAEVYTTWAQYYFDEVADSELRAAQAEANEKAALTARAELRQLEFRKKLENARRFVGAALKHLPEAPEAHRAAADYYRLAGNLEKAAEHIERARRQALSQPEAMPETGYIKALVALARHGNLADAVTQLSQVVQKNEKLIRCHYRLARLQAAAGDRAAALASLDRVLALNGDHERASQLKASLAHEETVLLALSASPTSATAPVALDGGTGGAAPPTDEPQGDDNNAGAAPGDGQLDSGPAVPADGHEDSDDETAGQQSASGGTLSARIQEATRLRQSGAMGQACQAFARLSRVARRHPQVLVGQGYCAIESGHYRAAVSHFRRAIRLAPNSGPAREGMAEAQRLLEDSRGGGASSGEGPTSGGPTTIRITTDRTPDSPRSDSLAVDSEPPVRPGEDLD